MIQRNNYCEIKRNKIKTFPEIVRKIGGILVKKKIVKSDFISDFISAEDLKAWGLLFEAVNYSSLGALVRKSSVFSKLSVTSRTKTNFPVENLLIKLLRINVDIRILLESNHTVY